MFDDILDFFNRRLRQTRPERAPSHPSGLPFDLPFLEDDDDDERGRRRHDDRRTTHRPSDHRSRDDSDWF